MSRILFVNIPSQSGLAHYANEVCNSLSNIYTEVELLTIAPFEIDKKFRHYNLCEVQQTNRLCPKRNHCTRLLAFFSMLRKVSSHEKPDTVILNGYTSFLDLIFLFLKPSSVPVFCIQHEVEPRIGNCNIGWAQQRFYSLVNHLLVHRYSGTAQILKDKYSIKTPVTEILHGLYSSPIYGAIPQKSYLSEKYILHFGSVRPDKGVDVLLQAYPGKKACQGLSLMIAGKGKGKYGQQIAAAVKQSQNVEWNNEYIPLELTADLFKNAAFVVLPNLVCRQSGTLRLAIYFETPVLVTDTGELPHIVNQYGIGQIIPTADPESLRNGLVQMAVNHKKLREYRKNIQDLKASGEMSWDNIIFSLSNELPNASTRTPKPSA